MLLGQLEITVVLGGAGVGGGEPASQEMQKSILGRSETCVKSKTIKLLKGTDKSTVMMSEAGKDFLHRTKQALGIIRKAW